MRLQWHGGRGAANQVACLPGNGPEPQPGKAASRQQGPHPVVQSATVNSSCNACNRALFL
jgi:hypothetical protein